MTFLESIGDRIGGWALSCLPSGVINMFSGNSTPEASGAVENLNGQAEAIAERSASERAGIFTEVFESVANRLFPDAKELFDVFNNMFSDPNESWRFENEFEVTTGILGMMPEFIQKFVLTHTILPLMRRVGLSEMADRYEADPDQFFNDIRRNESDAGSFMTLFRVLT